MERLPSEQVVVAAPMSFTGSATRLWRLRPAGELTWLRALGTGGVVLLIALAWTVVLSWYLLWGIFLIPFRLIRRGERKRKRQELQHRELLEHVSAAGSDRSLGP